MKSEPENVIEVNLKNCRHFVAIEAREKSKKKKIKAIEWL
jgi:hypothetical protein